MLRVCGSLIGLLEWICHSGETGETSECLASILLKSETYFSENFV